MPETACLVLQICIFQILILTHGCSGSHAAADATRQSWASWTSSSPPKSSSLTAFGRARETHRRAPAVDLTRKTPSRRCQIESRRGVQPHWVLGTLRARRRRVGPRDRLGETDDHPPLTGGRAQGALSAALPRRAALSRSARRAAPSSRTTCTRPHRPSRRWRRSSPPRAATPPPPHTATAT